MKYTIVVLLQRYSVACGHKWKVVKFTLGSEEEKKCFEKCSPGWQRRKKHYKDTNAGNSRPIWGTASSYTKPRGQMNAQPEGASERWGWKAAVRWSRRPRLPAEPLQDTSAERLSTVSEGTAVSLARSAWRWHGKCGVWLETREDTPRWARHAVVRERAKTLGQRRKDTHRKRC